jgi:hypothetical protein
MGLGVEATTEGHRLVGPGGDVVEEPAGRSAARLVFEYLVLAEVGSSSPVPAGRSVRAGERRRGCWPTWATRAGGPAVRW